MRYKSLCLVHSRQQLFGNNCAVLFSNICGRAAAFSRYTPCAGVGGEEGGRAFIQSSEHGTTPQPLFPPSHTGESGLESTLPWTHAHWSILWPNSLTLNTPLSPRSLTQLERVRPYTHQERQHRISLASASVPHRSPLRCEQSMCQKAAPEFRVQITRGIMRPLG